MKFTKPKFGFVIISPDANVNNFLTTLKSIRAYYPNYPVICSYPKKLSKNETIKADNNCDFVAKSDTMAGIVNMGIKYSLMDWNVILTAGTRLKSLIDKKYEPFLKDEKDILFPVINRISDFEEASFNGTMMHKSAFHDFGKFPECEDTEVSKLMWKCQGIEKGYQFKAIVNAPIRN